ncbi:uncharacterized protein LOC129077876 isoform X2 [Pteronotus mesoamericanus]|nr:uncharacterized protein LOC129077876 isoform X2 [Pteronotus parnellii mesoamericanus]
MAFGTCCQRERLKFLYVVQTFILAGMVCYSFQGSVDKTAPDHDLAGESPQPIGETLRPVWGPMDKCYPVTTQATALEATGGLSHAAAKEEPVVQSQSAGEVRSPAEEAASPIPAAKEVAEEEEVAGNPGPEGNKVVREGAAVYPSEASEVESKEDRPRGAPAEALARLVPSL